MDTYEKKYKDALERASKYNFDGAKQVVKDLITYIFPELKESEDEKVKKAAIAFVEASDHFGYHLGISKENVLDWLEKQGTSYTKRDVDEAFVEGMACAKNELKKQSEQKSVDKVEPTFKVGDWVVQGCNILKIRCVGDEYYCFETVSGYVDDMLVSEIDSQFHLWTIQDAKDGDILMGNAPFIFNGNLEGGIGCPGAHCAINTLGKFQIPKYPTHWTGHTTTPATKEQRNLLFQKMKEAGYEWDAEKKELKKINKNTDVGHEYFSDLLEKDDCDNIDDYAYQCAYCMSHDWMKETATWEDVQKAVKLGAEWNERHHNSSWSEEDMSKVQIICKYLNEAKKYYADINEVRDCIDWLKSLEDRVLPQPKQKWKQENTDDLTDFENAMMHIGESFFGKNAGLDPNDINAIKEQANTLLGLVPSKDWSEYYMKKLKKVIE